MGTKKGENTAGPMCLGGAANPVIPPFGKGL